MLKDKVANKRKERDDWVQAARKALIVGGIDRVKVDRLATEMNITRGSFYWFFKNRDELLDALLKDWEQVNTQPLMEAIKVDGSARNKFQALVQTWIDEKKFSPQYDSAVRDWARTSQKAARAVKLIDEGRIKAIAELFRQFGYDEDRSFVRARITYFHQVGYYAMHVRESRAKRSELLPLYIEALTGLKR